MGSSVRRWWWLRTVNNCVDGGDSDGAVGWGVPIWEKTGPAHDDCKLLDELWGPVVTNAGSTWYLGADTGGDKPPAMVPAALDGPPGGLLFSKLQASQYPNMGSCRKSIVDAVLKKTHVSIRTRL